MQFHAILSNPAHPEYGVATIPFPLSMKEYDRSMEVLSALEIGDAVRQDCKVDEITDCYPVLKRLEGQAVNVDELDYRSWFDEVGALYVAELGTFTKVTGDAPGENIGDGDYGYLAGTWYQDAEPGAASILTFDASGSWELLERPGGDGDPTVVDCGTIEVNQDGAGQYFAASAVYEDVVYDFTLAGDDVIYWGGEYDYYQKMA